VFRDGHAIKPGNSSWVASTSFSPSFSFSFPPPRLWCRRKRIHLEGFSATLLLHPNNLNSFSGAYLIPFFFPPRLYLFKICDLPGSTFSPIYREIPWRSCLLILCFFSQHHVFPSFRIFIAPVAGYSNPTPAD